MRANGNADIRPPNSINKETIFYCHYISSFTFTCLLKPTTLIARSHHTLFFFFLYLFLSHTGRIKKNQHKALHTTWQSVPRMPKSTYWIPPWCRGAVGEHLIPLKLSLIQEMSFHVSFFVHVSLKRSIPPLLVHTHTHTPTNRQTTMWTKWLKHSFCSFPLLCLPFLPGSLFSLFFSRYPLVCESRVILSKRHQLFAHIAHGKYAGGLLLSHYQLFKEVCAVMAWPAGAGKAFKCPALTCWRF